MKIKIEELRKALEIVKPGLANKEIIEQSTSFAFMGDRIVTYNDEISISCPVGGLFIEGAIPSAELYSLLSKLKTAEVDVEMTETEVQFKAGGVTAGLVKESEIRLPVEQIAEILDDDWLAIPKGFIDALKFTKTAASTDMSQPVLTCINIREDGLIESSDGFQIARQKVKGVPYSCLLPASLVNTVISFTPDQTFLSEGWVHFRNEIGAVLSCRVLPDSFVDTDFICDAVVVENATEITLPNTISEILDRAAVFCKRDTAIDEILNIKIEKKKMEFSAESKSGSWFKEQTAFKFESDPLEFSISPYLLKYMMGKSSTAYLFESYIVFTYEDCFYLAMLKSN